MDTESHKTALNLDENAKILSAGSGVGCYSSSSPISPPDDLSAFRKTINEGKSELQSRCILSDLSNLTETTPTQSVSPFLSDGSD